MTTTCNEGNGKVDNFMLQLGKLLTISTAGFFLSLKARSEVLIMGII